MSRGWWNQSERHAKARMGIKTTAIPKPVLKKNIGLNQHKLANHIQKDMNVLDKHLRSASRAKTKDNVNLHLKEAEKLYERLNVKIKTHQESYGSLPQWTKITWQGTENFSGSGSVKQSMNKLKSAEEKDIIKYQIELFNKIKLGKDKLRRD